MKVSIIIALLSISNLCFAQQNVLLVEGIRLEKSFIVEQALEKFEAVIKKDSTNAQALYHASRMLSNIGGRMANNQPENKIELYKKAKLYAERSIKADPKNVESRLAYIISLGLLSEVAVSPREKIKNAKIIRKEAELIMQTDSTYSSAYFVLGKWHYELACLNWFEQAACKVFLGSMPETISMETSIRYFKKAVSLEPESILFLYGEATVYHHNGNDEQALKVLAHALQLHPKEPDDVQHKEKCLLMLSQIKKSS